MSSVFKRYSSRETLALRLTGIAYFVNLLLFPLLWPRSLGLDGPPLAFVCAFLVFLLLLASIAASLREVYGSDEGLEFRWFGKKDFVRYSEIEGLAYLLGYDYGFGVFSLVTVRIRRPSGKVRRLRFIMRCVAGCYKAASHPDILEISKMAKLTVGANAAVRDDRSHAGS